MWWGKVGVEIPKPSLAYSAYTIGLIRRQRDVTRHLLAPSIGFFCIIFFILILLIYFLRPPPAARRRRVVPSTRGH